MITFTDKQKELLRLLHDQIITYVAAVGGSRSGKTFCVISDMLAAAYQFTSRQLVVRLHYSDVKDTVFKQTLPDVIDKLELPKTSYRIIKSDPVSIEIPSTESVINFSGLDNKERVDKILGSEYWRIFANESSQLLYMHWSILESRLAQVVRNKDGIVKLNKMVTDLNPTDFNNFVYKLFYQQVQPKSPDTKKEKPIKNIEDYAKIVINPIDNKNNLSNQYFKILDNMPEDKRKRFRDGLFQAKSGGIFSRFDENKHIIDIKDIPECEYYTAGVDLITYAAVLIGWISDSAVVVDECGGDDLIAATLNKMMKERWRKFNYVAYIDHNLSKAGVNEFDNSRLAVKGQGSVEAGIDKINEGFEFDKLKISNKCFRLLGEIPNYRRDENGKIIKKEDHYIDALRYGIFSTNSHYMSVPEVSLY